MNKNILLFSQLYHFLSYSIKKPKMQLETGMFIISIDVDVGNRKLGVINDGKMMLDDVCRGLLIKTFNSSVYDKKGLFNFICVGNMEAVDHLRKLGFKFKPHLVPYKYL